MGMADVATVLWFRIMRFEVAAPDWADRDRFVLSAGHGSMLLYALLHLTGFKAVTMSEIEAFRQWGSKTPGHPEYCHTPGVETTTGPQGQGLATAVGMAMAERHLNARFGGDLVDHRTWVITGDGRLMDPEVRLVWKGFGDLHRGLERFRRFAPGKMMRLTKAHRTTMRKRRCATR